MRVERPSGAETTPAAPSRLWDLFWVVYNYPHSRFNSAPPFAVWRGSRKTPKKLIYLWIVLVFLPENYSRRRVNLPLSRHNTKTVLPTISWPSVLQCCARTTASVIQNGKCSHTLALWNPNPEVPPVLIPLFHDQIGRIHRYPKGLAVCLGLIPPFCT